MPSGAESTRSVRRIRMARSSTSTASTSFPIRSRLAREATRNRRTCRSSMPAVRAVSGWTAALSVSYLAQVAVHARMPDRVQHTRPGVLPRRLPPLAQEHERGDGAGGEHDRGLTGDWTNGLAGALFSFVLGGLICFVLCFVLSTYSTTFFA